MTNTGYYTTHFEIVDKLSKIFKTKTFNPDTVHDWCAELENDILREYDYFMKFIKIKLEVLNGTRINLPCNVHSLINLYFENNTMPKKYHSGNTVVLVTPTKEEYVYVDYKGTPIDPKTGDVLILRGHEQACMNYCIKNSFMEDFYLGKIDANRWMAMDVALEESINIATQDMRRMDKGILREMDIINGSMLTFIGKTRVMNKEV